MAAKHLLLAISILYGLGCGKSFKNDAESAHGRVQVQIIAPGSVSDEPNSMPYSLATVELQNVHDLVSLSGRYARFYTNASRDGGKLNGVQPRGQFLKNKKDGVFVPKNFLSLQLATIYFHTQNLIQIENSLSLESKDLKRTTPLKIVLNTPVLNTKKSENNAIYDGDLDTIIYFKYSDGELPLSLNGGVFAHEYFHSIFDKVVIRKIKNIELFNIPAELHSGKNRGADIFDRKLNAFTDAKKLSRQMALGPMPLDTDSVKLYYALLVKGFNEGLADYWGWSYVNDLSFISHSIPKTPTPRTLDLKSQQLEELVLFSEAEMLSIVNQVMKTSDEKLELINAFSYQLGSRIALFFKSYNDIIIREQSLDQKAARAKMNQIVIDFIQSLGKSLPQITTASDHTQLVSTYSLIQQYLLTLPSHTKAECQFLKDFLASDTENKNQMECVDSNNSFKLSPKGAQ